MPGMAFSMVDALDGGAELACGCGRLGCDCVSGACCCVGAGMARGRLICSAGTIPTYCAGTSELQHGAVIQLLQCKQVGHLASFGIAARDSQPLELTGCLLKYKGPWKIAEQCRLGGRLDYLAPRLAQHREHSCCQSELITQCWSMPFRLVRQSD